MNKQELMPQKLADLTPPSHLAENIEKIVSTVNSQIIKTDEDYEISGTVLDSLSDVIKAIGEHYDDEVHKRHREHKEATHARSNLLDPINRATRLWKEKMGIYAKFQENRIAKEQKLVDEQAMRKSEDDKINLAAEMEKAGNVVTAEAIMEDTTTPIVVAPKIVASKSGASVTKVWTGKVVDMKAFATSIASGNAPVSLLEMDEDKEFIPIRSNINKFARATGGHVTINGVEFKEEVSVKRTGKRGG